MKYWVVRGALRFKGKEDMGVVLGLVSGDDDYTWQIPSGWPAPLWIDVYPVTMDARELLLGTVGGEFCGTAKVNGG